MNENEIKKRFPEVFDDGKRFQWREYGPRPNTTAYQIYAKGLLHIAECDKPELANLVCNALNFEKLLDDFKQLKCVIRAYDKTINELPIDEKIKFINKVPEHFREQAKTFIK